MTATQSHQVPVDLPAHGYTVHVGAGTLGRLGTLIGPLVASRRATVFADANTVAEAYGPGVAASLGRAGFDAQLTPVPIDEARKSIATVGQLYAPLIRHKMERKSPVIALGGGVLGDTVGFAAASYLRGVPFVQCPTTLLSMVDASVGGKVGVNLPEGKNLVGAFHQPVTVCIDINTLETLPDRELRCGLAECIKHAAIRPPRNPRNLALADGTGDGDMLAWLEDHADALLARDPTTLVELVRWNVAIKAAVVVEDERESGVRAHLNFGHTFAHAIEATTGYGSGAAYHHGEAVALGMVAAARLSTDLGLLSARDADRLTALIHRLGLPTTAADLPPTDTLMDAMTRDKKVVAGRIRLVLLDGLGTAVIRDDVEPKRVTEAWASLSDSF